MHIIQQYHIINEDLSKAHAALLEFAYEFELLYYQRQMDCLQFVRQSVHALTHLAPKVICIGPPACSSQWTMECTIGNLGQEMHQPSNMYTDLSQRGLLQSQINALKAMVPDLEPSPPVVPRGGKDISDGYILLQAKDSCLRPITDIEKQAFSIYLKDTHALEFAEDWSPGVAKWARLHLPNGQGAWSSWKEKLKPLEKVRMAQYIKVCTVSDHSLDLLSNLT
ncbi:hypothetical protein L208DRAFT_1315422 [Tricholoma matsutake]|nr:hypothetical protein L208DRAFT_1315422 [Tricholoma matsutake 945]